MQHLVQDVRRVTGPAGAMGTAAGTTAATTTAAAFPPTITILLLRPQLMRRGNGTRLYSSDLCWRELR